MMDFITTPLQKQKGMYMVATCGHYGVHHNSITTKTKQIVATCGHDRVHHNSTTKKKEIYSCNKSQ